MISLRVDDSLEVYYQHLKESVIGMLLEHSLLSVDDIIGM